MLTLCVLICHYALLANLPFHPNPARIQDTSRYALVRTGLPSRSHTICAVAATSSSSSFHSLHIHSPTSSTSSAPTRTPSLSTSSPACTGCLLEALNLQTLSYTDSVVGNTTITTATVYAYPTYYPDGTRLYNITYSTVTVTHVLPSNQTNITSTISWSTLGTWL